MTSVRAECHLQVSPGLQRFSKQIEGTSESASVDLLKAVDETVDALVRQQNTLRSHIEMALWFLDQVEAQESNAEIDESDEADAAFQRAQAALRHLIENLKLKKGYAQDDGCLNGCHEESVLGAYEETIQYAMELFDTIEHLRIALQEHDADASPVSVSFGSAEALLTELDEA